MQRHRTSLSAALRGRHELREDLALLGEDVRGGEDPGVLVAWAVKTTGAAPPVLGWTAVTGEITSSALLLFLIIFVWTPPHFWALAIARKDEYAKVGIPMLPVTHGEEYTRLHILLYTILLVVITVIPYLTGMSGLIYLAAAVSLGAVFLNHAVRMLRDRDDVELPMRTFKFSITYLAVLFAALLVDHYFLLQLSL